MGGRKHYNSSFRKQLRSKINNFKTNVFSRHDLSNDRSNKEQLRLNRALRTFMDEGLIIKISHGLFAKAELIEFHNKELRPVLKNSFEATAIEALNKLNIKWELGRAIKEYNEGKTTQVPVLFTVRLKSRFRGSIYLGTKKLIFEDNVNTK